MITKTKSLALAVLLLAAACGRSSGEHEGGRAPGLPLTRSGPLQPAADTSFSLAGGNLAGAQIVVDLSTIPDPAHSWATTACLPLLAPDYELGRASCTTGETRVITAGMTKQICSTDPRFGNPVGPTVAIGLDSCADVALAFYTFKPALSIAVVKTR
jgi:hypothetical protein